jgi:hypothetical protein
MKTYARVHPIDMTMLHGMWEQADAKTVTRRGMVLTATASQLQPGATLTMPSIPSLDEGGFTIDFWLRLRELSPGQTVLDARTPEGKGIAITMSDHYTLKLTLNDGAREAMWDSDPGFHPGTLKVGAWQHIAFVVDGGPKIITVMVDGVLNDGGPVREYGWGRFQPDLHDVNGAAAARAGAGLFGELKLLRIYDRYLRTSELMGNWRAGA